MLIDLISVSALLTPTIPYAPTVPEHATDKIVKAVLTIKKQRVCPLGLLQQQVSQVNLRRTSKSFLVH